MIGDLLNLVILSVIFGIAGFLPVVVLKVGALYCTILPELALFETYRERRCAVRTACARMHLLAWTVPLMIAIVAMLWVLLGGKSWLSTAPLWLFLTVFCFGPHLLANALFWCLFRDSIHRSLRQQLAARGVAICVCCGYDLRGQVEPRCPECGCVADGAETQKCEVGR